MALQRRDRVRIVQRAASNEYGVSNLPQPGSDLWEIGAGADARRRDANIGHRIDSAMGRAMEVRTSRTASVMKPGLLPVP